MVRISPLNLARALLYIICFISHLQSHIQTKHYKLIIDNTLISIDDKKDQTSSTEKHWKFTSEKVQQDRKMEWSVQENEKARESRREPQSRRKP